MRLRSVASSSSDSHRLRDLRAAAPRPVLPGPRRSRARRDRVPKKRRAPYRPPQRDRSRRLHWPARSRVCPCLRGTPYRFGGTTPADGFDCSGLVSYVARHQRRGECRAPSSSSSASGVAIERSDLAPGDLVFFSTTARAPTHVGIVTDVRAGRVRARAGRRIARAGRTFRHAVLASAAGLAPDACSSAGGFRRRRLLPMRPRMIFCRRSRRAVRAGPDCSRAD